MSCQQAAFWPSNHHPAEMGWTRRSPAQWTWHHTLLILWEHTHARTRTVVCRYNGYSNSQQAGFACLCCLWKFTVFLCHSFNTDAYTHTGVIDPIKQSDWESAIKQIQKHPANANANAKKSKLSCGYWSQPCLIRLCCGFTSCYCTTLLMGGRGSGGRAATPAVSS